MRDRLLAYIRRHNLVKPGDRVAAAVSGGADSIAILCVLRDLTAELGIVLSVAHFNHKIRGADADEDERFVRRLAARFDWPFHRAESDVPDIARQKKISLEAAARHARYEFFRHVLESGQADRIATAHTRDDQAETVLLRLLRGAGTRGRMGIHRSLMGGKIIRPMLEISRAEVETYLRSIGQEWREDATNTDFAYARNKVRHQLLPLLRQEYNPAIDRVLAESAEIARAEEEYWGAIVAALRKPGQERPGWTLSLEVLRNQPLALQRRLIRDAAEHAGCSLEFQQVEQVLSMLEPGESGAKGKRELPGGMQATICGRELTFQPRSLNKGDVSAYEYGLRVPGEANIREIGRAFRVSVLGAARGKQGYNECQLDPALLAPELRIRNWRPGDRYWPAHTKSPRKVKELLQDLHLVQPDKSRWPVVESNGQIVWIPGFAPAADFRARSETGPVVLIEEVSLGGTANRHNEASPRRQA